MLTLTRTKSPLRLPALPHPTRNPQVFDRRWMRAWGLLPIPRPTRSHA